MSRTCPENVQDVLNESGKCSGHVWDVSRRWFLEDVSRACPGPVRIVFGRFFSKDVSGAGPEGGFGRSVKGVSEDL